MNRDVEERLRNWEQARQIMVTGEGFRAQFSLDWVETEPEKGRATIVCQRDHRWKDLQYSSTSKLTMGEAGCLICCVYSLAVWAGCEDSLPNFVQELDVEGAFRQGMLVNRERVGSVYTGLGWPEGAWLPGEEGSFITWSTRPADLTVLQYVLDRQPCVVEVDFKTGTLVLDQHFVLAIEYQPAYTLTGIDDDLLVMDPWSGDYTSVLTYFNPKWLRDGSMASGVTKVQRTLTGARVWKVL